MQTGTADRGSSATLVGVCIGAGLSLILPHILRHLRENLDYDPVSEAQTIARKALGIE